MQIYDLNDNREVPDVYDENLKISRILELGVTDFDHGLRTLREERINRNSIEALSTSIVIFNPKNTKLYKTQIK